VPKMLSDKVTGSRETVACASTVILFCLKCVINAFDRMDLSPRPMIRSLPMEIRCPDPGCQISQLVITCIDLVRLFQILDTDSFLWEACLNQLITVVLCKYLSNTTLCQISSCVNTHQRVFTVKSVLKRGRFLRPQPPHFFGLERMSHLHR
jgi:hypothetical protein